MAGVVFAVSFIGIWACSLENKTEQAHTQREWGKQPKEKKRKKLLFVPLILICNLAARERQAQHIVLSATPRPGKLESKSSCLKHYC